MAKGYLALVLHAHLPFVRHPEYDDCLEERWFFEALIESYIPLLMRFEQLAKEDISFKLTLSLSPTLTAMLADSFLQYRFQRRLELLSAFSEKEVERVHGLDLFEDTAVFYRKRLQKILDYYVSCDRNLLRPLLALEQQGYIELIATAATHGYLPLLALNGLSVCSQISLGIETCRSLTGTRPRGFWLPECGYTEGLDEILKREGAGYTILETHGITRAAPRPPFGVYEPISSPAQLVFFGRDPESSRQVWSSEEGYPGDGEYREFYRDIAYDLDEDYLKPLLHPMGIRTDTGFKYHRITGKRVVQKDIYDPQRALRRARMHAEDFLKKKVSQINDLSHTMKKEPLIVAPFDAELFGHWWFEGPDWLYYLMKQINKTPHLEPVTLSEYIDRHPPSTVCNPCESSWGREGFHETWINEKTDWIYPLLMDCAGIMEGILCRSNGRSKVVNRACNQALRELLLAQASDWAFMITNNTTDDYAEKRIQNHVTRLRSLLKDIKSGSPDERHLEAVECRNNIFPELDYQKFCQ